jgi:hypothetical protein
LHFEPGSRLVRLESPVLATLHWNRSAFRNQLRLSAVHVLNMRRFGT